MRAVRRELLLTLLCLFLVVVVIDSRSAESAFTATTANSGSTLTAVQLNDVPPGALSATRISSTQCRLTWTAHPSAPGGATYDILDGGSTLATGVSSPADVTVAASAVTLEVRTRAAGWVATTGTTTSCTGYPDPPVPTATPEDSAVTVTWPVPGDNGSAITSYTATTSPASTTCTVVVPAARSCTFTGLTNGVTYTVAVTATNAVGTGPAGTSSAIPYPASIMTAARLRLWLDGADPSTMFSSSNCVGAQATTLVACWMDKSTQAGHATQNPIGRRPSLTTVSGHQVPDLDGVDDTFNLNPNKLVTGTTTSTTFTVARNAESDVNISAYRHLIAWGNAATSQGRQLYRDHLNPRYTADIVGTGVAFQGSTAQNVPTVLAAVHSTGLTSIWADGRSTTDTDNTEATPTMNTGTDSAFLGADLSGANAWHGQIPETIAFTGTLTPAERRTVESYLARKWGAAIAPDPPTSASATAGEATAAISWTAPSWDGGSAVTGYTATATPSDGSLPTRTCTATAPTTSCTVTGLTDGVTYTVTVHAAGSYGPGPESASTSVIPYPATIMTAGRLKLWLDGADAATLLASSTCTGLQATTTVGCWKDKSTQTNNAVQAAGGDQPTLSTVNGRSVPTFDITLQYLSADASLVPTGTATGTMVVAAAVDPAVAMNGISAVSYGGTTAGSQRRLTSWSATGVDVNGSPMAVSQAWPGAQAQGVGVGEFTSGTSVSVWGRGNPTVTTAGAFSTGTHHLWVGAHGSTTALTPWQGTVPEVIILDGALTAAERRTMQEYLARKWGGTITARAPSGLSVTPSTTTLALSWTAPDWDGGLAVTSYTATASPGGNTCTATAPATTCAITGLIDGIEYTVSVRATNAAGNGPDATATGIPYPSHIMKAPAMLLWLDAADRSTIFADPSCTGALATGVVGCWKDKSTQANNATQATLSEQPSMQLISGRTVPTFVGSTMNLDVTKMPLGTTTSTSFSVPRRPTGAGTGRSHMLSWGSDAGNSSRNMFRPISSTTIAGDRYFVASASQGTLVPDTYFVSATEFADPTTSQWSQGRVSAATASSTGMNTTAGNARLGGNAFAANGNRWTGQLPETILFTGSLSTTQRRTIEEDLARKWSALITPPPPTGVTGTPSSTQVALTWTAPAWDGNSAVTSYTATSSPGALTCTATAPATGCTVTGLTNGTSYTFTVTATNSIAAGPASTASPGYTPN